MDTFTHTLDAENTTYAGAIDVGANNTLAIVTTTGETAVYYARPEFDRFQVLSELIAESQSEHPEDRYTSKRIHACTTRLSVESLAWFVMVTRSAVHECELDAYSDVGGAWNLLHEEVGPMARPVALSAGRIAHGGIPRTSVVWRTSLDRRRRERVQIDLFLE
ncbi:transposase [Halapricum desulfuricans]|uniref:transposase n=1 Tax=Halapricum desulfuricans TaxID=2841257 RepID=UPI001E4407DE|nr:transposase [Halapricum desulfuricans]